MQLCVSMYMFNVRVCIAWWISGQHITAELIDSKEQLGLRAMDCLARLSHVYLHVHDKYSDI